MAEAFAEQGMNLALADIAAEPLQKVADKFKAKGLNVMIFPLDISDATALKAAAADVQENFGGIHLVCANAGVSGNMGPLEEGSDSDWDWAIDINIRGTVNTVQAFLPNLLKNEDGGHIVLTSSVSGLRVFKPSRGQGMYNTTKFALVGLGEALSVDLEKYSIGVSILCPGVVNTQISDSGRNRPEKYGGAINLSMEHDLAKASASGTDPLVFGRWVVKAIKRNQLYVITHDNDRALVEARHKKVMEGFDYCGELTQ